MPTTEELVNAVRRGDAAAFGQLVALYERAAIITAQGVLGDFELARDVAQDGFVIAYTKLNRLQTAAAFGPWLLKIVHYRACLVRRRRRSEQRVPNAVEAKAEIVKEWMGQYEEVIEQLGRLPEHERMVIVLRYVNGHSPAKIAESTGIRIGTVKKQLSRGLARLRRWLTKVTP